MTQQAKLLSEFGSSPAAAPKVQVHDAHAAQGLAGLPTTGYRVRRGRLV